MPVFTKWDQSQLDKIMSEDSEKYLIAAGELMQNNFAANSPVITGLLKNSMSYHTSFGKSSSVSNNVSEPIGKNLVRAGSGIIYAASVEARGKSAGWMARTWDKMISGGIFERLQKVVFRV
jgi:hypothetical protein